MSKRRTREQKIKAQNKYQTTFSLFATEIYKASDTPVKGYFIKEKPVTKDKKTFNNNPLDTEQYSNLKLIKKDLIKSLFVSSFILCLIVVLYLTWYKL
jgi:hypothetical protein